LPAAHACMHSHGQAEPRYRSPGIPIWCCVLQVRAELPAPRAGQLPLPASLAPALQQQLSGPLPSWQQLPWPQGATPQQPQPDSRAALQFKVRGGAGVWCSCTSMACGVKRAQALRSRGDCHCHGIESYLCDIRPASRRLLQAVCCASPVVQPSGDRVLCALCHHLTRLKDRDTSGAVVLPRVSLCVHVGAFTL
jgi:hypothetical protein